VTRLYFAVGTLVLWAYSRACTRRADTRRQARTNLFRWVSADSALSRRPLAHGGVVESWPLVVGACLLGDPRHPMTYLDAERPHEAGPR
jgi:hypothetical protein